MSRAAIAALVVLVGASAAVAQTPRYSLLLAGGHVIDPKNGVDAVMDVAIADGKVAAVAAAIDRRRPRASPTSRASTSCPG